MVLVGLGIGWSWLIRMLDSGAHDVATAGAATMVVVWWWWCDKRLVRVVVEKRLEMGGLVCGQEKTRTMVKDHVSKVREKMPQEGE